MANGTDFITGRILLYGIFFLRMCVYIILYRYMYIYPRVYPSDGLYEECFE